MNEKEREQVCGSAYVDRMKLALLHCSAKHWPCTARHEAGHAVAAIMMYRELGRNYYSFHRVLIRPGATGPFIDSYGRERDCLGILERASSWKHNMFPSKSLREVEPWLKHRWLECMTLDIIIALAGPFAQARVTSLVMV